MTFYSSNTHWIRGDFSPLSPNSDENEISSDMFTARFKHSTDENKRNNH